MKALLQICMMFYFSTVTLFGQSSKNEIDNKIDKANELLDAMNRSDEAMPILLQSYEESKSINYQKGLLESNKAFARLHIDRGNYKKVIEFASDAETIGKELKDYTSLAAIYRLRGVAFMRLGFLDDGFKDTKLALENAKKVEDESKRHYYTALSDHNLVYYYQNKNAPQDTILKYLMDGLSESEQIKDDAKSVNDKYFMVINLHVSIGMFYAGIHQPQRLDLAEKHLLTALKYKETQPFAFKKDELNTFNSLGRFYDESGNATEAIKYASQVLQIEKNSKSPLDRHIAYATLANS
jgi:tetratricopeptide (TPR) repeat protein